MKKAFTLIELLIVLIIIGIITVLAIPQYQKIMINAQGAEAKQNLRALADSAWRYYIEAGHFPTMRYDRVPPSLDDMDTQVPAQTKYFIYRVD